MSRNNYWKTDKESIARRVFVGGLSPRVTEAILTEYMVYFGPIVMTKIVRTPAGQSKGFGYVTFKELSAIDAIRNYREELRLDGQHIDVKEYDPSLAHINGGKEAHRQQSPQNSIRCHPSTCAAQKGRNQTNIPPSTVLSSYSQSQSRHERKMTQAAALRYGSSSHSHSTSSQRAVGNREEKPKIKFGDEGKFLHAHVQRATCYQWANEENPEVEVKAEEPRTPSPPPEEVIIDLNAEVSDTSFESNAPSMSDELISSAVNDLLGLKFEQPIANNEASGNLKDLLGLQIL